MTALPLCARPGCLYAAVTGTDRCLPHTEPGKGDGSYHGVYHREGAWPAPEPAAEQAPVAARPYTEVTGIPIEHADWEYFGRAARQAAPAAEPGVDDEATAEVLRIVQDDFARHEREYLRGLQLDVRPRGGITENGHVLPWPPYLQPALDEAARQSAAQLAATVKRINAKAAAPPLPPGPEPAWGWLGRLLNRLFA